MTSDARKPETIALSSALRRAGARLVLTLLQWQEMAQQRRRLQALDDRMLRDLGISRADARREGSRPFWDARDVHWRRWR